MVLYIEWVGAWTYVIKTWKDEGREKPNAETKYPPR
jgi:hypothetical protein